MDTSKLITVSQAAAMRGVHRSRIDQLIHAGKLPVITTIANVRLLHPDHVNALELPGKAHRNRRRKKSSESLE